MPRTPLTSDELGRSLHQGHVIPAHPLALDASRRLDAVSMAALTRYYAAAGAGGVAVAVHTTQFALREHGMLRPVLELVGNTLAASDQADGRRRLAIAGVCGDTRAAVAEAELARDLGYDLVLPSLVALRTGSDDDVVTHHRALAEVLPVFAFYLQPAVGGRIVSRALWCRILAIPGVRAVKIAPFDRYRTLDVVRAVAETGRAGDVALYTGNDDAILWDLLSEFRMPGPEGEVRLHFAGGLLGQWAVWTRRAAELLDEVRALRKTGAAPSARLRTVAGQLTEANAALFDAANDFAGCIPGIHEVLVRQGLMQGPWCLDPSEDLSPGQVARIDRILENYPHLTDNAFVAEHLEQWRRGP